MSYPQMVWIVAVVAINRMLVGLEKWMVLMGGAVNYSFICKRFHALNNQSLLVIYSTMT